MNLMLTSFTNEISTIFDEDYGDFMRSANVYLNHLRSELHRQFAGCHNPSIEKKLNEMQEYLQFNSNWEVSSTRRKLERDCQYLDELMAGHQQDWESRSFS